MRDSSGTLDSGRQRTRWIHRIVAGFCIAGVTACSDSPMGPRGTTLTLPQLALADASEAVDITGSWTYHEDATFLIRDFDGDGRASVKAFRCSSDGVYTFAQTGDDFTGSYDQVGTCSASDGTSFPNNFTAGIVTGSVHGHHIDFITADGCRYEAALRGETLATMGGAGMCGAVRFGGTYRATFSAVR